MEKERERKKKWKSGDVESANENNGISAVVMSFQ